MKEGRIEKVNEMERLVKKLLPCPFCGSKVSDFPGVMIFQQTQEDVNGKIGKEEWAVQCYHCHATGSPSHLLEWAVEKWNQRKGRGGNKMTHEQYQAFRTMKDQGSQITLECEIEDIQGECPMNMKWDEKARLTPEEVEKFCEDGCSVSCPGFFIEKFGERLLDE